MNFVNRTNLISEILTRLKNRENNARQLLKLKQEQIVFADGPNESRGISATRFALDNEITMAENELKRLTDITREIELIKKMKNNKIKVVKVGTGVTVEINKKQQTFLITKKAEDIQNHMLPISVSLGEKLLNHREGDIIEDKVKIVSIM